MDDTEFYADLDPALDGLPETADDDSHANEERDFVRFADGPAPLPPDREDGPLALDEYGTTPAESSHGESLDARLARELPEDSDPPVTDPDQYLAAVDQVGADTENLIDDGPVDPHLESEVSMYDREVPGVPSARSVGRLVQPDQGATVDTESTEVAYDAGLSGGGFSAEEAAMHELTPEEPVDPLGSDVPARPMVFRTGADQPWDPEDLAVAEGRDPTPANVERARRELEEWGAAAIEKTVP